LTDFSTLLTILSLPRANGSRALKATCLALCNWLSERNIRHRLQKIRYFPYYFEALGIGLLVSQVVLTLSIWLEWGAATLLTSAITLLLAITEGVGWSPLSKPQLGAGENILIEFPAADARQELVLSAHYDTKTELLDHVKRAALFRYLPIGVGVTFVLGLIGLIEWQYSSSATVVSEPLNALGKLLTIPQLLLLGGLGLNFAFGRLAEPSRGAVDNGAACAILLAFADRLNSNRLPLQATSVTICLFTGEEVLAQGARAYVRSRDWRLPTVALNLEIMGQNGDYLLADKLASPMRSYPVPPWLNAFVSKTITDLSDRTVHSRALPVVTDSVPFLLAGVSATTLLSLDREHGAGGMHRPTDNLERVDVKRLDEAVELLVNVTNRYDRGLEFRLGVD
jgi:hypothetical protein